MGQERKIRKSESGLESQHLSEMNKEKRKEKDEKIN